MDSVCPSSPDVQGLSADEEDKHGKPSPALRGCPCLSHWALSLSSHVDPADGLELERVPDSWDHRAGRVNEKLGQ